MNNKEFTDFLAYHFEVDHNTAQLIIDTCSKSISKIMLEGKTVDIDNLGAFATKRQTKKSLSKNTPAQIIPYLKPACYLQETNAATTLKN